MFFGISNGKLMILWAERIYRPKRIFKRKSSVWDSAERAIFSCRFWCIAEFQMEPLDNQCYLLLCYPRNHTRPNLVWIWSSIIWNNISCAVVPFKIQPKHRKSFFWRSATENLFFSPNGKRGQVFHLGTKERRFVKHKHSIMYHSITWPIPI